MQDIKTIPTEKLVKDLEESRNDVSVCQVALDIGIFSYSGGSVKDRKEVNENIIRRIQIEIKRRAIIPDEDGGL